MPAIFKVYSSDQISNCFKALDRQQVVLFLEKVASTPSLAAVKPAVHL